MVKLKIYLMYSNGNIKRGDTFVPMTPMGHFSNNESLMCLFELTGLLIENSDQEVTKVSIK